MEFILRNLLPARSDLGMKNFVNIQNGSSVELGINDLPILIHGREHTGSSLFSITVACHLYSQGNKILMFTAYPMAKEEFISQVGESSVFYLEDKSDLEKALSYQTIIVKSGDKDICAYALLNLADIQSRIVFIKNVDQMLNNEIVASLKTDNIFISGDIDLSEYKDFIKEIEYKTKIYFSPSNVLPEELLPLEKYQACVIKHSDKAVVALV